MARSYTVFATAAGHPGHHAQDRPAAVGVPVFSRARPTGAQDAADGRRPRRHGQKAQTVGYSVGGKSGTARKQVGKSYAAGKYRAWFTGLAPIDKPRIIVAVMVDEPSNGVIYGGAVAAPCSARWCSRPCA
jgi:cell division protein FtsI (penicillin-binding protein 3)